MKLLMDQGNSCLKWAFVQEKQKLGSVSSLGNDQLQKFLEIDMPKPQEVWVSNVAGDKGANNLCELCHSRWSLQPNFVHAEQSYQGLTNGYAEPKQLGVDRWLAIIAAMSIGESFLVVSAGSAITLDLVNNKQHLGGIILAGLRGLSQYFNENFLHLDYKADYNKGFALATNTSDALNAGIIRSTVYTIESILREYDSEQVICSGGDGQLIAEYLLAMNLRAKIIVQPHLVLEGLNKIVSWEKK